jgi:DNA-binding transcriptional LysR family regulator
MVRMIGNIDQAWRRLEVRHLAALEVTARLGSFRAAAAALGYSQSALSAQIAALEAIVGTPLLNRPRGAPAVSPTPAGHLLLDRAARIGDILASTRADLATLAAEHAVLRVGIFQSASARLLPPLIRAFHAAQPDVDVRLHEALDPQELTDLALIGDLDIVFSGNPPLDDALARVHLLDDPYVLLVSDDHPLAAATNVDPATVARLPLITYRSLRADLPPPRSCRATAHSISSSAATTTRPFARWSRPEWEPHSSQDSASNRGTDTPTRSPYCHRSPPGKSSSHG